MPTMRLADVMNGRYSGDSLPNEVDLLQYKVLTKLVKMLASSPVLQREDWKEVLDQVDLVDVITLPEPGERRQEIDTYRPGKMGEEVDYTLGFVNAVSSAVFEKLQQEKADRDDLVPLMENGQPALKNEIYDSMNAFFKQCITGTGLEDRIPPPVNTDEFVKKEDLQHQMESGHPAANEDLRYQHDAGCFVKKEDLYALACSMKEEIMTHVNMGFSQLEEYIKTQVDSRAANDDLVNMTGSILDKIATIKAAVVNDAEKLDTDATAQNAAVTDSQLDTDYKSSLESDLIGV